MLIGIDASRANQTKKTGVEWYGFHLIQALKRLPQAEEQSWLLYAREPLRQGLEQGPSAWHETLLSWPLGYLWTQMRLSWEMLRYLPDVLFVPSHVLPRIIPKRTVVTIHDVGFHTHPELYPGFNTLPFLKTSFSRRFLEWSTRDIAKRASRVLTVSEFSKQMIVDGYGCAPERIFVIYPGIDHSIYRPQLSEQCVSVLTQLHIPAPFALFIGRLEKKKNVAFLIRAFDRYKQIRGIGDPLHLVLIGMRGAGYDEIRAAIRQSLFAEDIFEIGYATEEEKLALLSSALALVHPSLYEGFGIPPLEAMACGCPVLCARTTSIPEVVGEEQALWFDPNDLDACARAIARIIDEPEMRQSLCDRGREWVKRYSWDKTARQVFEALTTWD